MTGNKKVYKSEFNTVCFVMFSLLQKGHDWDLLVRMKVLCLGTGVSLLEFVFSLCFLSFFIAAMHVEAQLHSFWMKMKTFTHQHIV